MRHRFRTAVPAGCLLLAALAVESPARATEKKGLEIRVEVSGLEGEAKNNVLSALSLANLPPDRKPSRAEAERLYGRGPEEIRRALEPFGYWQPEVEFGELEASGRRTARTF